MDKCGIKDKITSNRVCFNPSDFKAFERITLESQYFQFLKCSYLSSFLSFYLSELFEFLFHFLLVWAIFFFFIIFSWCFEPLSWVQHSPVSTTGSVSYFLNRLLHAEEVFSLHFHNVCHVPQTLPRLLDSPSLESKHAKIASCGARHSVIVTGNRICQSEPGSLHLYSVKRDDSIPKEVLNELCKNKPNSIIWIRKARNIWNCQVPLVLNVS